MTTAPIPASARPRFTGLDGLRAIAVLLVLVYHLFPASAVHSGFVGVDVFFVISGFLITSLLLRERATAGRIALVDFWRRRARRLLPALVAVVTVTATWALLIGGDVLVRLGRQSVGAATFGYNWVSIAGGTDYFRADTPELLRNIWSLAVEEQFYVLWPLLLPLLLMIPRVWARVGVIILAAAASATWMGVLVHGGADPTRAYFGTDSHAFGLLLGVALAVGLQRMFMQPAAWLRHPLARAGGLVIGVVALCALVVVALRDETGGVATFPGTLVAASLAAAVLIVAGAAPGSWFGRVLDATPLRWIGDRSYGIYLWHWPLFVLLSAMAGTGAASDTVGVGVGVTTLAATAVIAELSYRLIEQPVRRHGFRGAVRALGARLTGTPGTRFTALVAVTVGMAVVGGTTAAIAVAPAESSGQSAVQAGADALRGADAQPAPPRLPTAAATGDVGRRAEASTPRVLARKAETVTISGESIDAIGDSVMLASAPALMARYPGIHIDAAVSRSMWAAPSIVRALRDDGRLRPIVVLGLGTNGPVSTDALDAVREIIGPSRRLVLVNASAPRWWIAGVNTTLDAYADEHATAIVADWDEAIAGHGDLLAGDHIHPGDEGGQVYAEAVDDAITRLETRMARERDRMLLRAATLAKAGPGR